MSEAQPRFTRVAFLTVGTLLIWLAAFVIVYVFAALACAREIGSKLPGVPVVPIVTTIVCLAAAVATALLMRKAGLLARVTSSEPMRFIGFVTLMTGALSLIAIVFLAAPALLVGACVQ